MIVPAIHLNGTSKNALLDAYGEAVVALNMAYNVIKETAPNGRDYYPLGPNALTAATEEHMDRLRRVDAVRIEIEELMTKIDEL